MGKYPTTLMSVLLEAAVGVLLLVVIFWIITWILAKIWIWVLVALLAIAVLFGASRYRRWREWH